MLRLSVFRRTFYTGAVSALLVAQAAPAERAPADAPKANIRSIQLVQQPPSQPPPSQPPPPTPPPMPTPTPGAAAPAGPETTGFAAPSGATLGGTGTTGGAPAATTRGGESVGAAPATGVSGAEAQTRASSDVTDLLAKSQSTTGFESQKRNPIIGDPRVRGYHAGQLVTFADGGFFLPARQDLDSASSKYDASNIRDAIIIKGPYSVRYGPGFSFLDINTYDTPRYEHGSEAHSRTNVGYQTNGPRWNGMETIWGGGCDWGFRASYGIMTGADYRDGNGVDVPSMYNSQNVNFAVGFNTSPDSRIEFKGLQLNLKDIEFAGLYFDLTRLYTNAYTLRYTLEHQPMFDRFAIDFWHNRTAADGNTLRFAKQQLLTGIFAPTLGAGIQDRSTTNFSEMSQGYRMTFTWGERDCPQLTVGSDYNYVHQELNEFILLLDATPEGFPGFPNPATQDLGIPPAFYMDPGVFAEVSMPFSKQASLKAGVRGDLVQTNSYNRFITSNIPNSPFNLNQFTATNFNPIIFSVNPTDLNLQQTFDLWSAYVNGEYKFDNHLTMLSGFGYAQRPPTLTELYATGPFLGLLQPGLDRMIGDPHLEPEQNYQFDIGLRADYGWFRGGANGFYAYIHDYVTFDLNSSIQQAQRGLGIYTFRNTDWASLAGGELFGETDVTEWLTPFGSLNYVQGRDLTHTSNPGPANLVSSRRSIDQEPLPGIFPLEARTGFRVHEGRKNPRWSTELALRMVAGQDLVATSLGELPTPGFTIWDVRGFWQANESLLLTAGVLNIGDRFYREHLDPRAGNQMFQPGTNFYFGVQLQY